ncbi:MAG: DUF2190 family protein [Pseudomonadota bacterium]
MRNYVQDGDRIDVVATTPVVSGDVDVVGTELLGVAVADAETGDTAAFAVRGVFLIPKVSAADITQGEDVIWDASANAAQDEAFSQAAGDFVCGKAWQSAGVGTTTVAVRLKES